LNDGVDLELTQVEVVFSQSAQESHFLGHDKQERVANHIHASRSPNTVHIFGNACGQCGLDDPAHLQDKSRHLQQCKNQLIFEEVRLARDSHSLTTLRNGNNIMGNYQKQQHILIVGTLGR
jgi:hypothetical protein